MGSIVPIKKLSGIGHLSSPILPTGEVTGPRRPPKDRHVTVLIGADKVPLMAPEVTLPRHQGDPLIGTTNQVDAKPTFDSAAHVGSDVPETFLLIPVIIPPVDANGTGLSAGRDEAFSNEIVEIELQAILQLYALTVS